MSGKKRYFVLVDDKGNELGVFTGKSPRQAALKAANRGYKKIKLRERGTKKYHIYEGWREKVKAPENRPSWMPETVYKPNVKKIGIEHIKKK